MGRRGWGHHTGEEGHAGRGVEDQHHRAGAVVRVHGHHPDACRPRHPMRTQCGPNQNPSLGPSGVELPVHGDVFDFWGITEALTFQEMRDHMRVGVLWSAGELPVPLGGRRRGGGQSQRSTPQTSTSVSRGSGRTTSGLTPRTWVTRVAVIGEQSGEVEEGTVD